MNDARTGKYLYIIELLKVWSPFTKEICIGTHPRKLKSILLHWLELRFDSLSIIEPWELWALQEFQSECEVPIYLDLRKTDWLEKKMTEKMYLRLMWTLVYVHGLSQSTSLHLSKYTHFPFEKILSTVS
jgi:hypothetical protein